MTATPTAPWINADPTEDALCDGTNAEVIPDADSETVPFASVRFPMLVPLAWLVVPVAGGYLRFRDAQIG